MDRSLTPPLPRRLGLLRGLSLAAVLLATATCGGESREKAGCDLGESLPCICPDTGKASARACTTSHTFGACSCEAPIEPMPEPDPIHDTDPTPNSAPHFVEASVPMGLAYHEAAPIDGYSNCAVPKYCEYNLFTGAAAVGDYDNDGYPDLYVSRLFNTPILFRNRGDGTFEDRTAAAGLALFGNWNGAAWLDIDDDGDLDLMALTVGIGRHHLFVNQGDGTFVEDAVARGLALDDGEGKLATSEAVGDYDRDGWLDLHVGEWSVKGLPGPDPGPAFPEPTHPGHTRLFRNLGAANPGHFEDVTVAANAVVDPPNANSNGMYTSVDTFANALADFDGHDWPDLALTGDFATSRFLWKTGDTSSSRRSSRASPTTPSGWAPPSPTSIRTGTSTVTWPRSRVETPASKASATARSTATTSTGTRGIARSSTWAPAPGSARAFGRGPSRCSTSTMTETSTSRRRTASTTRLCLQASSSPSIRTASG
jgi:hypothetical protein